MKTTMQSKAKLIHRVSPVPAQSINHQTRVQTPCLSHSHNQYRQASKVEASMSLRSLIKVFQTKTSESISSLTLRVTTTMLV